MSSTAAKAPMPTTIIIHNAIASQGKACLGGNCTPLVHNFGSFHTYSLSWTEFVRIPSEIQDHTTRWRLIPECRPCMPPLFHGSRPRCSADKRWRSPTRSETYIHYRFLPGRSFPKKKKIRENVQKFTGMATDPTVIHQISVEPKFADTCVRRLSLTWAQKGLPGQSSPGYSEW